MKTQRNKHSVQALISAFELLEILTAENIHPTAPFLAKKMKIKIGELLEILNFLEEKNFIEHDGETGVYRFGLNSFGMAQQILKSASVIKLAQPIMEDLARKHDEAVYITILNKDEVFFLDMVDSFQQIRAVPFVGKHFPFFTNAAGKVIKAMGSPEVLEKLGKRRTTTSNNIDFKQLESELIDIRSKGVAVDIGGLGEGICSVAVAFKDYAGMVVGALTLLGPSFRMWQERIEQEIIPSMLKGSEELSLKFGYAKTHA